MQNERKITILGDTGETLELEQLSLLVLHDPETDEEREILILVNDDGESSFFEVIDEDTIEQVFDEELIEALLNLEEQSD